MEESMTILFNNEVGEAQNHVAEAAQHMQDNFLTLYSPE